MNVTFRFCFRSPLKSLKLPVFKGLSTDLGSHSFLHISFYPLYTHVTGYDWDKNDKPAKVDQDIDIDDAISFEFKQGGTFNEYCWTGNKWKIECSGEGYTISGNKLTTYEEDGINVLDVYTIQSINSTTMVLKYNLDGNASYPSTITFKKIK